MIAVAGNLSIDIFPGRPPEIGGGPYHAARALSRLRVPARLHVRCAPEDKAALLPPLVRLGTPVRFVSGTATASCGIRDDGDTRRMTLERIGDTWEPADVADVSRSVGWVHVAPLARSDFPARTLAALARNHRVSFDAQGLVRVPERGPLQLDADYDEELLRHIWVLKVSEEEAPVLGDLRVLGVREVVLTRGSNGATVIVGGHAEEIPTHPLAADSTGAGDAFATAYVVARNAGFAPVGAARRANAVVASLLTR